jgi:coenzyme F420-reducing hydrogenase beta subunit
MKIGYDLNCAHNRATAYIFREDGKRLGEVTQPCRVHALAQIKEDFPEATEIIQRKGRVWFVGTDITFQAATWSKKIVKANKA